MPRPFTHDDLLFGFDAGPDPGMEKRIARIVERCRREGTLGEGGGGKILADGTAVRVASRADELRAGVPPCRLPPAPRRRQGRRPLEEDGRADFVPFYARVRALLAERAWPSVAALYRAARSGHPGPVPDSAALWYWAKRKNIPLPSARRKTKETPAHG